MSDDSKKEGPKNEFTEKENEGIKALQQTIEAIQKTVMEMALKVNASKEPPKSDDVIDKVKSKQTKDEKEKLEREVLEKSIKFNLELDSIIEKNKELLPEDLPKIIEAAKLEKYESAIHNANESKRIVVQSFFAVQENLDLLTEDQKERLTRFLTLTKEARLEQASNLYDNLFQPALVAKEKIRKVEEVSKAKINSVYGYRTGSNAETAYEDKMRKGSEDYYFGGEK